MSCFLVTGVPCPLTQSPRADLFEVHVTIGLEQRHELADFLRLCQQQRWKAIVIDLDPRAAQQPMTCSRVTGSLADAHAHAEVVRAHLTNAGFAVNRVKLEAAPWNSHVPHTDRERLKQHPSAYFEYHTKLHLPSTGYEASLAAICTEFDAHVSRNALRQGDDGWIDRFATIRSYRHGLENFQEHTRRFRAALQAHGFSSLKDITEYCIYDSNTALDAAWYAA